MKKTSQMAKDTFGGYRIKEGLYLGDQSTFEVNL